MSHAIRDDSDFLSVCNKLITLNVYKLRYFLQLAQLLRLPPVRVELKSAWLVPATDCVRG